MRTVCPIYLNAVAAVVLPEVGVGQMEAVRRLQHDVVGNALAPPVIAEIYTYIRVSLPESVICFWKKTGSKAFRKSGSIADLKDNLQLLNVFFNNY